MKLGKIAKIYSGGTPSRTNKNYWNGSIPWIKTAQVQNCIIKKSDVEEYITEEGLKNSSTKIIPKGTILMAMYGQGKTRGQVAILSVDSTINQACAAIELDSTVYKDFIYQQLLYMYKSIRKLSNTGSQENLSADLIKQINLFLPTIHEQKAIADILSTWDLAIEKLEKLIELKEKRFDYNLNELIINKAKKEKWKQVKLRQMCNIPIKQKLETVETEKLLTVKLHCQGIVSNDRIKPAFTEKGRPYYRRFAGEFLIGRQNFHNGGFGIVPQHLNGYIASNAITTLEIDESCLLKDFLLYQFSSSDYYKKIGHIMDGTGQKELSDRQILDLKLFLPEISRQEGIVIILNSFLSEINLLRKFADKYKSQKQGLMQKLLTGQWRVKI